MPDAISLPSDLFVPEIALDYAQAAFYESLEPLRGLVGSSPDSPIRLVNFGLKAGGQYVQGPVLKQLSDGASRRDITSTAAIDTKKIEARNDKGVLINGKFGPHSYTPDAEWLAGLGAGGLSQHWGTQLGQWVPYYVQQLVISSIYGAVTGMTSTAHTVSVWNASSRTNMSTSLLAQMLAKMADSPMGITAWIMRSEPRYDLVNTQLGAGVQGIADRVSAGQNPHTLGRPYFVLDHAVLTAADAGFDKYRTIGIGPGAVEVEMVRGPVIYDEAEKLDQDTVERQLRADFDFAIRIPGFQWDSTNGGANPTEANLQTTTNWDETYTSHKEVSIVYAEHNYSGN